MRGLLAAIGFLTRLPVPAGTFDDERAKSASLAWYPLVGLLLGSLLSVLAWLLRDTSSFLSAGLVTAAWVALTGALHLDGLADSADAWIGGLGDREKTLTIMKDPRCGPAGVVALVLMLCVVEVRGARKFAKRVVVGVAAGADAGAGECDGAVPHDALRA